MRDLALACVLLLLATCKSNAKDGEPKAKPAQDAPMGWPRKLTAKDHTLIQIGRASCRERV